MKSFVAIVHTIAERWFDHYAVYYISCDYTDEEDLQRLETRFRVHEFSKTFDGPNHAIACRIVSPCSSTVLMPAGLRYSAVRKRDKGTSTDVPFYSEPSGTFFHRTFSARAGPSSDRQQLLIGGSTVNNRSHFGGFQPASSVIYCNPNCRKRPISEIIEIDDEPLDLTVSSTSTCAAGNTENITAVISRDSTKSEDQRLIHLEPSTVNVSTSNVQTSTYDNRTLLSTGDTTTSSDLSAPVSNINLETAVSIPSVDSIGLVSTPSGITTSANLNVSCEKTVDLTSPLSIDTGSDDRSNTSAVVGL